MISNCIAGLGIFAVELVIFIVGLMSGMLLTCLCVNNKKLEVNRNV